MRTEAVENRLGGEAAVGTEAKNSIDMNFAEKIDQWIKAGKKRLPGSGLILVGTTSDALKSIGVKERNIYVSSAKLAKIMKKHPEVDENIIKKTPEVMEKPILIMQSLTRANSVVLLGELRDGEGDPVLVSMKVEVINGQGEIQDYSVITKYT